MLPCYGRGDAAVPVQVYPERVCSGGMREYRPRRTTLAVPANNPRFLARARQIRIDEVFLDLEDAVAAALGQIEQATGWRRAASAAKARAAGLARTTRFRPEDV